jgi:hypothetical protein
MTMKIPYQISEDEALQRIKGMINELKQQHGNQVSNLKEDWQGNTGTFSLTAQGFNTGGTLTVEPNQVVLNGDIPWAAKPFQGMIEATIRERVDRLLAP